MTRTELASKVPKPPTRASRDDGYGRSSRFYQVETELGLIQAFPSVTTVLSCIGKPALIGWAAREERTLVSEAAADLYLDSPETPKMARAGFLSSLEDRLGKTRAHQRQLKKAGEIGTAVHAVVEWQMRKDLGQEVGACPSLPVEGQAAFAAFQTWRDSVKLKPLMIEQTVWSKKYGFAGTMDWLGEMDLAGDRVVVVGDWKTSKGLYPESNLQNAAYTAALIEMGHLDDFSGGCIVRLPKSKDDPGFEEKLISPEQQREDFQVFLNVLELWRWQEKQHQARKEG